MPDGFYRIVAEEPARLGYGRIKGGKGSHEKWRAGPDDPVIIVPRNLKSRHTANGILKDAGSTLKV